MAACEEHIFEEWAHILKESCGDAVGSSIRENNIKIENLEFLLV